MTVGPENIPPAPYVGLRPFEFHEAALFYGRGEHIAEMARTLRKRHFLAVIGSSGSGKSSLVRAGLLPAISAGFMNGGEDDLDWRFVIMRPGLDPYENLLRELLPKLAPGQSLEPDIIEFRRQTLRGGPRGLLESVADSLLPEPARLVVAVDQFEEIFRFLERGGPSRPGDDIVTADRRNAALAFVDMLLSTTAERDPHVYVVLTMRSEYLGDCEAFLGLSAAVAKSQFLTPRMTREQVQDVIERPIAAVDGRIEPQVVTALLNSLGTAQDQLPRVEHALLRMWHRACKIRQEQPAANQPLTFTLEDYRAVGFFETALDLHGEQLYRDLAPESEAGQPSEKQRVAERLFRSLAIRTSQGTLVRRLSTLGEVASIAAASEQIVTEVVEHFRQPGCNFLVATPSEPLTGKTTLDISHESLLRQWKRMGEWVTAESDAATELQRLVRDAEKWKDKKRGLLRQPELGLYARWRKHVPSTAWALHYVTAEEFSLADEYLAVSTRDALAEERAVRRRFLLMGGALVLAVVVGASFGLWQAGVARAETERANKQSQFVQDLVDEKAVQSTQGELAVADDLKQEDEWAMRIVHLDTALDYSKQKSESARWEQLRSKEQGRAAAALWAELRYGAASRAPLIRCLVENKTVIRRMAWSPRETVLATAGKHDVFLWSFSGKESADVSAQPVAGIDPSKGDVSGLRFSPDGKTLLVIRDKGWEVISIEERKVTFSSLAGESVLGADAFSPDGIRAVSRLNGGPPRVIYTKTPTAQVIELPDPPMAGEVAAWSPKGDRIALTDGKRMVSVYSISEAGASPLLPNAFEALADVAALRAAGKARTQVNELSFSASGDLLLVMDNNGRNRLFEIWALKPTGAEREDRAQAEFRAWIPDHSVLLDIPIGNDPAGILNAPFKRGRNLPIKDPSAPRFFAGDPEVLFIQSQRNYQVLNLETGYAVTPPFGWWTGPITARLTLHPGLIASVENLSSLAFWDLRPEQPRWHADPPQPPPVAPVRSPDGNWIADIGVDQRVQVAPSDDDSHPTVVISLDEQPSTVGWAEDGRKLRIYSKIRGYIDLEWDPPTETEESIHKLVQLLVIRKYNAPEERFKLRKEMHTWKTKDPRWQKLLDWWIAGRPSEPLGPNARLITDVRTDSEISSAPADRDDPKSSVWVFHDSNTRPLTAADLRDLNDEELWTARNEIYARRGVRLRGERGRKLIDKLGSEFHASGVTTDDAYDIMNGVERANIMLIKSTESQRAVAQ